MRAHRPGGVAQPSLPQVPCVGAGREVFAQPGAGGVPPRPPSPTLGFSPTLGSARAGGAPMSGGDPHRPGGTSQALKALGEARLPAGAAAGRGSRGAAARSARSAALAGGGEGTGRGCAPAVAGASAPPPLPRNSIAPVRGRTPPARPRTTHSPWALPKPPPHPQLRRRRTSVGNRTDFRGVFLGRVGAAEASSYPAIALQLDQDRAKAGAYVSPGGDTCRGGGPWGGK